MLLRRSIPILPLVFAATCSRGVRPEPPDAEYEAPAGGRTTRGTLGSSMLCTNSFFPQETPDAGGDAPLINFGSSEVLILFDGSESETVAHGRGTRASAMADAIKDVVDDYQGRIAFGLMRFPDAASCGASDGPGCCVGDPSVELGLNQGPAIRAALDNGPAPQGSSPIAMALQRAATVFQQRPYSGESRLVLLATDGQPGCGLGQGDASVASSACQEAVQEVQNLAKLNPPIRTLVLSPGPGDPTGQADCLGALIGAAAVLDKNRDASVKTNGFTLVDLESLGDVLESTFVPAETTVPNCQIALFPDPLPNAEISVYVDGQKIPEDKNYGWEFGTFRYPVDGGSETATTVSLRGEYCERLRQFRYTRVVVTFDCRIIARLDGRKSEGLAYCKT